MSFGDGLRATPIQLRYRKMGLEAIFFFSGARWAAFISYNCALVGHVPRQPTCGARKLIIIQIFLLKTLCP